MKDLFSRQSGDYASFRPVYPPGLTRYLSSISKEKELAWDCATGNGQTAVELARHFKKVFATDASPNQLAHAVVEPNIQYAVEEAEACSLPGNAVDLVTVSQALHWFQLPRFYEEVKRVSKRQGIIAAWTYGLLNIDPAINTLLHEFHYVRMADYWDEARVHVDNGYAMLPFPFTLIESPVFEMKAHWSLEQLVGYLNTWSAVQKFIAVQQYNPVDELQVALKTKWPLGDIKQVNFPLTVRIGKVHA